AWPPPVTIGQPTLQSAYIAHHPKGRILLGNGRPISKGFYPPLNGNQPARSSCISIAFPYLSDYSGSEKVGNTTRAFGGGRQSTGVEIRDRKICYGPLSNTRLLRTQPRARFVQA